MFSTVLSTKLIGPLRTDSSDSHKANSQESNLLTRESFSSFPGGGGGGTRSGEQRRSLHLSKTPHQAPLLSNATSVPWQKHVGAFLQLDSETLRARAGSS